MSILCISYADEKFQMSLKLNLFTARFIGGADCVKGYGPKDLDPVFLRSITKVEGSERGAGFYAWKPYVIRKALKSVKYGDYVMYADAGSFYISRLSCLRNQLVNDCEDILLSGGFAPCKDWCKRDAFVYMGCDCEQAKNATMVSAGYVFIRKTSFSERFVDEWLKYASDERIISDQENTCGLSNYVGFRENRHDQTVLSILRWKYGLRLYKSLARVDSPRMYLNIKKGGTDGYRYSWHKRVDLILNVQNSDDYKKSRYGRILINTQARDADRSKFIKRLLFVILDNIRKDLWAVIHEKEELEAAKKRMERKR